MFIKDFMPKKIHKQHLLIINNPRCGFTCLASALCLMFVIEDLINLQDLEAHKGCSALFFPSIMIFIKVFTVQDNTIQQLIRRKAKRGMK